MADSAGDTDKPLVEAGKAIRQHANDIVSLWIDRAQQSPEIPFAHRQQLRDHLPSLLEHVGRHLENGRSTLGKRSEAAAESHGRQRWQLGWRLDDVVRDYQTLRPVLIDYLLDQKSLDVTPEVQSAIAELIDEAIVESVQSFLEFQDSFDTVSHRTAAEFSAIISSSADAIISMDIDGTIQSWNHAAQRIYGYEEAEAIGQSGRIIHSGERLDEFDTLLNTVKRGHSIESTDTTRVTKDGKEVAVAVSASPIRNRDGEVIGCSTIAHDISDRVRAAEALKRALEDAETANRTKGRFLANVSHELRSPMNAIVGMLSLALDEDLTTEVRDNLQVAQEAVRQLNQLVDDLLDVSKLDAGSFKLEDGPFSLRSALDETMRLASLRAYQKGIEIACQIDSEVPDALISDSLRLQQVLNNLVNNAVKFTERGEVLVEVSLVEANDSDCQIAFRVSDTGIGISREDREKIFAPFAQADASSTRQFGGSGLGLSIASHLVACLGGELTVESELGKGSIFSFVGYFRRNGDEPRLETPAVTRQHMQDVSALVVDDHEANRAIVQELLSNWGIQARGVETGEEALQELQEGLEQDRPYQLAIVDALMPRKNGFELIEEIVELDNGPPASILMISPSDRTMLRDQCDSVPADAFLEKPISQSSLFNTVASVLTEGETVEAKPVGLGGLATPQRSLSVLVVEDTKANQRVVQRVLERRGHQCTLAGNGREAIEYARERSFDVILMDVQMPVMDGFQATAAIREWESRAQLLPTPIIAITAHAMQGDRDRCLAAGMSDYIAKPLDILELAQVVEKHGLLAGTPSQPGINLTPQHDNNPSTPTSSEVAESIDLSGVLKRLRGDRGLLADLAACYLEDYQGLLQAVEDGANAGDTAEARRNAHSLKNLAMTFNAEQSSRLATEMEELLADGHQQASLQKLPVLTSACNQLADLLRPYAGDSAT
ncbi:response regulator [Aeoliella sp.]|uniref:hybrid sensor histidine kinase/response regulator n=1 Tax=Aeoliella sp. TaxID=2795800 RepID=UPI003CCC2513